LSSEGPPSAGGPREVAIDPDDTGLARERTALAWTRSALNMAASGTLIARAGFTAHLAALGLATAIAMAVMVLFTWRHGQAIYRQSGVIGADVQREKRTLGLLTAATVLTAVVAIVVTLAT
jgi:uncharacterized membrane protein YidH (DUF202 family)